MSGTASTHPIPGARLDLRARVWPRGWSLLVVGVVLTALLSLLYLNQTSELAADGYAIADLQSQEQHLQMQNQQLRFAIAREESLSRIDQVASTRLGLGPPRRTVFVTVPRPPLATPTPGPTPASAASNTSAWPPVLDSLMRRIGRGLGT